MFNFNAKLNKYALRPIHVVWASIMPKYGMDRIQNAYKNIEYPKRLVSTLLQKDLKAAKTETLRFLANSTIGLGGMYDPAKRFFKLEPQEEDIEQGLSKCKIKRGPFLVLPVINATTPRALAGRLLETGLDPTTYIASPVAALVKMGLFINRTSFMQPLSIYMERTYADPYDITRKLYGMENYIKNSNLDRKEVLDEETKIIGFENHGGQTFDTGENFGTVLYGNGNKFGDLSEGFRTKNVIATYLHGPLLSKNPKLADYIIKYALERKYNETIELEVLDDSFENQAREQLIKRFLESK